MSTIACSCTIQQIPTLNSPTIASLQVPKNFLQGVMKERTSVGTGLTNLDEGATLRDKYIPGEGPAHLNNTTSRKCIQIPFPSSCNLTAPTGVCKRRCRKQIGVWRSTDGELTRTIDRDASLNPTRPP